MAALEGNDVLAVLFRDGSALLCGYIEEYHNGLRLADYLTALGVDGALLERKTLVSKAGASCLHDNGVAVEDGRVEVGFDVGDDGYNRLQTEVGGEHFTEVLVFAKVVVREVAIVVDVAIGVKVVEANLNVNLAIEMSVVGESLHFVSCVVGSRR